MSQSGKDKIALAQLPAHETDRLYQRIMEKWLKGHSPAEIARSEGNISLSTISTAVRVKRDQLKEVQVADIEDLIAERIAGLKTIRKTAYDYLEAYPEKAPQLLTVALRSEETQAKIQGVLSEKVMHLGRIQHEIKMYDFTDNTPGAMIIDVNPKPDIMIEESELEPLAQAIELEEDQLMVIPDPSEEVAPAVVIAGPVVKRIMPTVINSVSIIRAGDFE